MANTKLSRAAYVARGYGQLEPNHLSAQRNGQIYAQLPAKGDIDFLENGQFAKYNYAAGVVDFVGPGEWMLVYNEVKLYRERETYEDFALVKTDYNATVYSPLGQSNSQVVQVGTGLNGYNIGKFNYPVDMPAGSTMVPRLFKTMPGDIMTTNTIDEAAPVVGDIYTPSATGYLSKTGVVAENATQMKWQVVKVYTLADLKPAVKLMRIQ